MDAGEGNSRGDKGKGKVPDEGKRKKLGKGGRKTSRMKKQRTPDWRRDDGQKWNPGDPLPDYPTSSQIAAHNKFVIDRFFATVRREEGHDVTQDPAYQVVLDNYRLPPDEEVPEGAETRWVAGDVDDLPPFSSDSSQDTSEESSADRSD